MFLLSIQNLIHQQWSMGVLQLVIALGFAFILWRNIQQVRCNKDGNCNSCSLPAWITKYFTKKES
jgi:hypothetical protein